MHRKIFKAIPFLWELRTFTDWTFTTTGLDIIQWFKLEDAYGRLKEVKG